MKRLAILFALLWGPAFGQEGPAAAALDAIEALRQAQGRLESAEGAQDRIAALTRTVQAFELGLSALRDGMREASIRKAQLDGDLAMREAEIGRLLGVLQTLARSPEPTILLHPSGPTGTVRSAMIVSSVTPALQDEADALAADLAELALLEELQGTAIDRLEDGLRGVQAARQELSLAMANRTELPLRFADDPARLSLLLVSAETLEDFARGLGAMTENSAPEEADFTPGALPSPVLGLVLRRAGEADAAGIVRPGVLIATRPEALVTTPVTATLRYAGPLLEFDRVVVLEPLPDHLMIFAGLSVTYGNRGEVIPAGQPVGLMGGTPAEPHADVSESDRISSNSRTETLYIEVRNGQGPIDPATWFVLEKEEDR